ncbi:MAG: NAD(P)-dependent oxidoreductase [bacterium]|nr:NAD(P)-dependent oxidoreductase [bacterium]
MTKENGGVKILVTGGAGYIGTSLVPILLQRGYEVTILDTLMYGGTVLMPLFRCKDFHFIRGDIRDYNTVSDACQDKDIIIHLAAIVGFPACREDSELAHSTNVIGTRNIAKATQKGQYVLYSSTGSNYGALLNDICTEETPLNPLSVYGKTKTEAEKIIMEETNCVAYRFATGFGVSPRLRLDLLINEFCYQAVKQKYLVVYESNHMRTFIHVNDMARAFLFAIDHISMMSGHVFNVGSEELNFSKRQIVELIAKETGAYVHYADIGEDSDKRNYVVSYKKLNDTGFQIENTIESGIKELIRALGAIKTTTPLTN